MNNNINIEGFIESPDTVDIILRISDYLLQYINKNPEIILAKTLTGGFITAFTNVKNFENIINNFGTDLISSLPIVLGTLDRQNIDAAGITQVQQQQYYNLTGRGVLVGIVDTGIDYTQNVFRNTDGTSKIQFIFDQTITVNPPENFFVGTEYSNAQINEALKAENPYDIVLHKDTSRHGTFVASVAAGRATDDYIGAAPDAELIVVKVRKARQFYLDFYSVPKDQENAFESSSVMIGVEYVLDKARQLNRPVVICLGLGSNSGGHDGSNIFEEYLSSVSNIKGVCVCNAAGNESQARHHTQGVITSKNDTKNIDVKIGSDAGDVLISIWTGLSDRISVSVRSPTGEQFERFIPIRGKIREKRLVLEQTSVSVIYYFPLEKTGSQLTEVKLINATPGVWTITLFGDIIINGSFYAWLPMTGFISPNVELLAAVPYTTITVPGTMIGAICCGAYDSVNNILYSDSSWGPTLAPLMAPDFVAPGVNVGGYYPTGYGTMTGTSVSTAITAGACALMLQWGIVDGNELSLSTNQIRAYLIRGCNQKQLTVYPNPQWGYGTLNLFQTFQNMREI